MVVMEEGATVPGGNTNRLHGKLAGGRAIASWARGRRSGRRSGGGGVVLGRRMQRRMRGGGVQYVAGGMRRMQLGGNVVTMRLKLRRKRGHLHISGKNIGRICNRRDVIDNMQ